FRNFNDLLLRHHFGVMGFRTQTELKEIPCVKLEVNPEAKKSILSSRSFGRNVTSLQELQEAVSTYTTIACEKLRKDKSVCRHVYVWVRTNKHKAYEKQYYMGDMA